MRELDALTSPTSPITLTKLADLTITGSKLKTISETILETLPAPATATGAVTLTFKENQNDCATTDACDDLKTLVNWVRDKEFRTLIVTCRTPTVPIPGATVPVSYETASGSHNYWNVKKNCTVGKSFNRKYRCTAAQHANASAWSQGNRWKFMKTVQYCTWFFWE